LSISKPFVDQQSSRHLSLAKQNPSLATQVCILQPQLRGVKSTLMQPLE